MTPSHYDLYEEMTRATRLPINDTPPDELLEPMLDQALRIGADSPDFETKEHIMTNSIQAENREWQANLNEHVTHLPPYVTAEYSTPADSEGIKAPIRIRPANDPSMYAFEVSAPDDAGDVTLAATKTFESDILQKPVTESAPLKTYQASHYDKEDSSSIIL